MSAKKITSDRKRSRPVTKRRRVENKYVIGIIVVVIAVVALVSIYVYIGNGTNNVTVGNPIAVIDTSEGTIRVELYSDKVPNTCENFINLANDGFYDGIVFHRVMDNFMIQTGGFEADGNPKSSPYGQIDLEIDEELRHVDGAIAMARQGQDMTDPTFFNTATSQFYICDEAQHGLDDYYTVFGKVIEGMDVVRSIASVNTTTKYGMEKWPIDDIIINSIEIEYQ